MDFLHYTLDDRFFLLVLSQFLAILIGGPRWLHHLLLYDAPAQGWRRFLSVIETRLNRLNRPVADRKMRGRLVLLVLYGVMVLMGVGVAYATTITLWGWYVELLILAYLIPVRACILPVQEVLSACKQRKPATIPTIIRPYTDADIASMDGYGLFRATITHAARCLPRYVIAPTCWYLAFGMAGLLVCRLTTCLSDMFPVTHPRTRAFSSTMHWWDKVMQLVPARIAVMVMWVALLFVPSANLSLGAKAFVSKPAEAPITTHNLPIRLVAYGLGVSLGGPYDAGGIHRPEPWIGSGSAKATIRDVYRSFILYGCSGLIWIAIIIALYL